MYDKDGSGSIELPEMIEIIGTLYEMEGVPKVRNRVHSSSKKAHRSKSIFIGFRIQQVSVPIRFSANLTSMEMANWTKKNLLRAA